jgi:PAS domain S-box-containing protein
MNEPESTTLDSPVFSLSTSEGQASSSIPIRVLLIEDNPGDACLILQMLQEGGVGRFMTDRADRLSSGLGTLSAQIPDVVLLDLNLPDSRGITTFSKVHARFPEVPIVVLTGLSDGDVGMQAVHAGAQDYLVKGVISGSVLARVLRYSIERKRAEAEHLRLATAIDQAAEAVVITGLDARIDYVNPAFTTITGYSRGEALGQNPRLLKSGCQDSNFYQAMWHCILAGRTWHGEMINRRKDGALYTEEMTIAPVRDSSGAITNFIAIKQDVTARKRAEEALFRSQRVLAQAEQLAHVGAWESQIADGRPPDEFPLHWSDETYRIFGYTPGNVELSTKLFFECVHPEDRTRVRAAFAQAITDGTSYSIEHRIQLADGTERMVSEHAEVVLDQRGRPERAIGAVRDITERRRAEEEILRLNANLEQRVAERTAELEQAIQALKCEAAERQVAEQAAEKFRRQTELILNSAGEGICGLDLAARCTFANPAACRILGYAQEELIGQDLHILFRHCLPDGSPCPPEKCGLYAALTQGRIRQDENQLIHRKDSTCVQTDMCTTPILENGAITGAVLTLRDVSERRAMEKMKDEFVSVVSHELRTPLTAMRGALGLLASGKVAERPDQAQRLLDIALQDTERLTRLVNDVLDCQRLEAPEATPVRKSCHASDLMIQATDLMHPMAETAGVTLETNLQPALVLVDPDAILQVLTNLLSNAIKFSPPGSTVHLAVKQDHEEVVFTITDRGQGIPRENLESIFERFHPVDATDSRRRGGTGLGLYICRKIVQRHGGQIWAESELGCGSTFVFTLPVRA